MATVNIPALKQRYQLGDVVESSGVTLRGRGRVRQGVCPFHEENEGSFTVYADSQRWFCFGCGLGGDVLDFIQRLNGVDLPEAIRRLQGSSWEPVERPHAQVDHQSVEPLFARDLRLLTAATHFHATQLRSSPEALDYLASRGIDLDAAQRLGLGFATGTGLREHLRSLGFDDGRLRASGLFSERGERFDGMIVVPEVVAACPVPRHGGRVHWLAGRAIAPEAKLRFQALPGPKPVLGLGRLPCPTPWIVITEGLFDWLTLASWGIPAVAAPGAQGLEKVAAALRGQPRIFLAFDSDDAGKTAAVRLRELLGEHRSRTVEMPAGVNDVADLATQPDGRAVFLDLLKRTARVR